MLVIGSASAAPACTCVHSTARRSAVASTVAQPGCPQLLALRCHVLCSNTQGQPHQHRAACAPGPALKPTHAPTPAPTQLATRGSGTVGEDITFNAPFITGLPQQLASPPSQLPPLLEVRGEVYIATSHFAQLNQEARETGGTLFTNPRNLAAGSIRVLDPELVAKRGLRLFAYQVRGWLQAGVGGGFSG